LQDQIESELGRPLFGKSFTDDVQLNERALAARHGLGFKGRHTLIIGPKLSGSYNFIGELFTDLELEPDEAYAGTCGKCFRCGDACPTNAITSDNEIDSNRCISFLTIENKVGIPIELRLKLGNWVFGCDICQEVCPYNQRPDQTPWKEFLPDAGVGHYLDLPQLLEIKDEAEFRKLYAHTPLSRAKRSGLLRNALVVMGNALRTQSEPLIDRYEHFKAQRDNQIDIRNSKAYESSAVIDRIKQFMRSETNPMLIEHATWALSQQEMM
jgi:epoxyqueuosine reductase